MWNISSVLTYPLSVSWVNCPVCSLAQLWAGCLFPYSSVFTRFVLWVCLCVLDYQSFIPWVFCDLSLLVFLVRSCFKTVKKILNYLGVSSHGKPSLEMRPSLHSPKKPEHIWLQVPAAYNSVHSTPPRRIMAAFASFYCSRQQWIRLTGGLWMTVILIQPEEGSDCSLYLQLPYLLARNISGVFLRALSRCRRFHIIKHLAPTWSTSRGHRRTLWKTIDNIAKNLQPIKRQILRNIYHFLKLTNIRKLAHQDMSRKFFDIVLKNISTKEVTGSDSLIDEH